MDMQWRIPGSLVVVFLLATLPAWAQHAQEAASRQAVLLADWPQVTDAARAWQQQEPGAVVAAWLLGYAGLATGDYRQAAEGLQRLGAPQTPAQLRAWAASLVADQPQNAMAQLLYGDALARTGAATEALAALDQAVRLQPRTALLYDVRGVVRARTGQDEAAAADFHQALTLDNTSADAQCNLGLLFLRQGRWDAALAALSRALDLAPTHPAARNARGVAYLQTGDLASALADLTQAVHGSPDFPAATANQQAAQWEQARLTFPGASEPDGLPRAGVLTQQVIVIDIPGMETQGERRPTQWGPVLIGSPDFARYNIRHVGAFGVNVQQPEPGVTTTLTHVWNAQRDPDLLAPVLADIRAGQSTYIKVDQNIKVETYFIPGKPEEGAWVQSVCDWLTAQVRQINPSAKVILNAHSKGTLDGHALDLTRVDWAIFGSDRGSVSDLKRLTARYPTTTFTLITGDRDFAHGLEGFMKLEAPKVTVINLKSGGLLPTTVHGQVTDPTVQGRFEVQTAGRVQRREATLGSLVQQSSPWRSLTPSPGAINAATEAGPQVAPGAVRSVNSTSDLRPRLPAALPRRSCGETDCLPAASSRVVPPPGSGPPPASLSAPGTVSSGAPPAYRLPSNTLPGSPRGGVKMAAEVVQNQPADTRGLFGGSPGTPLLAPRGAPSAVPTLAKLFTPFLVFCAGEDAL